MTKFTSVTKFASMMRPFPNFWDEAIFIGGLVQQWGGGGVCAIMGGVSLISGRSLM